MCVCECVCVCGSAVGVVTAQHNSDTLSLFIIVVPSFFYLCDLLTQTHFNNAVHTRDDKIVEANNLTSVRMTPNDVLVLLDEKGLPRFLEDFDAEHSITLRPPWKAIATIPKMSNEYVYDHGGMKVARVKPSSNQWPIVHDVLAGDIKLFPHSVEYVTHARGCHFNVGLLACFEREVACSCFVFIDASRCCAALIHMPPTPGLTRLDITASPRPQVRVLERRTADLHWHGRSQQFEGAANVQCAWHRCCDHCSSHIGRACHVPHEQHGVFPAPAARAVSESRPEFTDVPTLIMRIDCCVLYESDRATLVCSFRFTHHNDTCSCAATLLFFLRYVFRPPNEFLGMVEMSNTHVHIPGSDLHRIYVPAGQWAVAMVDGRQVILDPAAKAEPDSAVVESDQGNGIWIFRAQQLSLAGPEPIDAKKTELFNVTRLNVPMSEIAFGVHSSTGERIIWASGNHTINKNSGQVFQGFFSTQLEDVKVCVCVCVCVCACVSVSMVCVY